MSPMKLSLVIALPTLVGLLACSPGPSRATEVEQTLSGMIEAEEIVAIYNFEQIVVNISGQEPFSMERNTREDLAERLAHAALEVHPDAATVMIGFNRFEPEVQQVAYTWENQNGSLSPVVSQ